MKYSCFRTMIFLAISIVGQGALGFGQHSKSTAIAGSQRGDRFSDNEIPSRVRISEVDVFSDTYICAVQLIFTLSDDRMHISPRHGGSGGELNSFPLNSDEYIIGLSGRYGAHIDSLRIHTNKRTSPLFGGSGGAQDYRIDIDTGYQAAGFVGRSGRYLNAIGLLFVPLTIQQAGLTLISGGAGGSAFSDFDIPLGARISEIRVHSGDVINAIQAVYALRDGSLLEGQIHGKEGGSLTVFALDPKEYVTGFSGKYGIYINSLSIWTNRRTSQVFGGSGGQGIFSVNVPAGNQAIGFRGRSGSYLDAIGLNYAHIEQPRHR
jgi:hypothetical protein